MRSLSNKLINGPSFSNGAGLLRFSSENWKTVIEGIQEVPVVDTELDAKVNCKDKIEFVLEEDDQSEI